VLLTIATRWPFRNSPPLSESSPSKTNGRRPRMALSAVNIMCRSPNIPGTLGLESRVALRATKVLTFQQPVVDEVS
jgi:hypothetical protein